jgi:hypothetical protein
LEASIEFQSITLTSLSWALINKLDYLVFPVLISTIWTVPSVLHVAKTVFYVGENTKSSTAPLWYWYNAPSGTQLVKPSDEIIAT